MCCLRATLPSMIEADTLPLVGGLNEAQGPRLTGAPVQDTRSHAFWQQVVHHRNWMSFSFMASRVIPKQPGQKCTRLPLPSTGIGKGGKDASAKESFFYTFIKRKSDAVPAIKSRQGSTTTDEVTYWPTDLLAHDLPSARIFTYGYDAQISHFFNGPASQNTITQNGRQLLTSIASKRRECLARPILFIAHSLGGIVVKSVRPTLRPKQAKYKPPCADQYRLYSSRLSTIMTTSKIYRHLRSQFCSSARPTEGATGLMQRRSFANSLR